MMISRARKRPPLVRYTPLITWTVIYAYVLLGLGMTIQPVRFSRTPSYGNLVDIAPIQVWGSAHLLVALLLFAWRLADRQQLDHRKYGIFAHTATAGLTVWWLGAFVIRWLTDSGTTIVNVTTWSVLLSLVVRSMWGLDEDDDDDDEPSEPVLEPEPCDRTTFPSLEDGDGQ